MADELCASCRWVEIQPGLFGGADERCGHSQATWQHMDAHEMPTGKTSQHHLDEMRRPNWPCGPGAELREARDA